MFVAAIVGELSRFKKLPPNAVVERMVGPRTRIVLFEYSPTAIN
jgi:hypothetical protein